MAQEQNNNMMQRAKNAVDELMNNDAADANQKEQQTAHNAIEDAKNSASPEEQQQLEDLKQQLQQKNQSK